MPGAAGTGVGDEVVAGVDWFEDRDVVVVVVVVGDDDYDGGGGGDSSLVLSEGHFGG